MSLLFQERIRSNASRPYSLASPWEGRGCEDREQETFPSFHGPDEVDRLYRICLTTEMHHTRTSRMPFRAACVRMIPNHALPEHYESDDPESSLRINCIKVSILVPRFSAEKIARICFSGNFAFKFGITLSLALCCFFTITRNETRITWNGTPHSMAGGSLGD